MAMDRFDFEEFGVVEPSGKSTRGNNKKRRWREIEAIKDKMKLKQELESMDFALEFEELPEF
jgi:uncharacterized protein with ACT and thioredoxin-like domain